MGAHGERSAPGPKHCCEDGHEAHSGSLLGAPASPPAAPEGTAPGRRAEPPAPHVPRPLGTAALLHLENEAFVFSLTAACLVNFSSVGGQTKIAKLFVCLFTFPSACNFPRCNRDFQLTHARHSVPSEGS